MGHSNYFGKLTNNLVWKIVALLRGVSYRLGDTNRLRLGLLVGDFFYTFSRKRAKNAAVICSKVLDIPINEAKQVIHQSYRNQGRSLTELLAFSRFNQHVFEHHLNVQGLSYLESALSRGRGVILLSAHLGNWELAAAWLGQKGYPIRVIGARQPDPRITELLDWIRASFGVKTLWTNTSLRETLTCLHNNQILGVMFDQDGGPKGAVVPFLGVPARTVTGPIRLAQKTGAVVLPLVITRRRENPLYHTLTFFPGWEIPADGEAAVLHYSRACNDLISSWIRQYPDQWLYEEWLYDRWIFEEMQ